MAASDYYVDPSLAADSGLGTEVSPYGDLQYALNNITRDATDGDIIHIKAGAEEVLVASLTLATYGTPAKSAPLSFRGYTTTKEDGGIAQVDCGGVSLFEGGGYNNITLQDMKVRNGGSATLITSLTGQVLINVWIDDTTGDGVEASAKGSFAKVFVTNVGRYGLWNSQSCVIDGCFIKNGASREMIAGIRTTGGGVTTNTIIEVDGASDGIQSATDTSRISGNSIYHRDAGAGATGAGIELTGTNSDQTVYSNLVDGFEGGKGIDYGTGAEVPHIIGANAVNNCATPYSTTPYAGNFGDDETLGASPFLKTGSITDGDFVTDNAGFWDAVYAYYAPVDTGNVRTGGKPYGAKGAVAVPAGGGGTTTIVIEDGMIL